MSEEGSFGIKLVERFFGLILLTIGALTLYYVATSIEAFGSFAGFFGFLNVILIALGLLMITAKTE
ncbi:hypothetical protein MUP01_12570 [Candidatus Bathyarchaeota archaeon]|nr:hypothetical protein [Candidatus Bathyarchaeota archaeon]